VCKAKNRYFRKVYLSAPLIECACGCGVMIKSKDRFGRNKKYISGHNGRKYADKTQYKREWNHRNRAARYTYKTLRIKKLREKLIVLKGGKCTVCGVEYNGKNACIFDFHHLRDKKFGINKCNLGRYSLDNVMKELEKCVLRCSNCHRMTHSDEY
jgi:hypothetical protein